MASYRYPVVTALAVFDSPAPVVVVESVIAVGKVKAEPVVTAVKDATLVVPVFE
jgi:hypothetical protein